MGSGHAGGKQVWEGAVRACREGSRTGGCADALHKPGGTAAPLAMTTFIPSCAYFFPAPPTGLLQELQQQPGQIFARFWNQAKCRPIAA
eukprot:350232-Chlamydomonas_euryale.AAC.9